MLQKVKLFLGKYKVFIGSVLIFLAIVAISVPSFYFLKAKNPDLFKLSDKNPSTLSALPTSNLLVYVRCINGQRNPDSCILYTSELFKPETERQVFSYSFSRKDEDQFNPPNSLHLYGVTKNYVVYSATALDLDELGYINLLDGTKTVISHTNSPNSAAIPEGVFVDSQNSNIYFYTCSQADLESCSLNQLNILSGKQEQLVRTNGFPTVRYADNDKLYLDIGHMGAAGNDNREIPKIFDFKTKTLQDMSLNHVFDAISRDGKRVVFIENEKLGTNASDQILKVSDIDGKNEITLYKTPISTSAMFGTTSNMDESIQNAQFSQSGFSVIAKIIDQSSQNSTVRYYQWTLGVDTNPDFTPKNGIIVMPPPAKYPVKQEFVVPQALGKYAIETFGGYISLQSAAYSLGNYKADIYAFTINTGYTDIGNFGTNMPSGNITYLTGLDLNNARPIILGASDFILTP